MADIKQAAKWMQEGKKVRRPGWHGDTHYAAGTARVSLYINGYDPTFNLYLFTFDLLADDWEVADV